MSLKYQHGSPLDRMIEWLQEIQANDDSSSDDDGDDNYQPQLPELTQENLNLFDKAKNSAKDLGYAEWSSTAYAQSTTAKLSEKTPTDFDTHLEKKGNIILGPSLSRKPENFGDIVARLNRSRGSASPPESAYEGYTREIREAAHVQPEAHHLLSVFKGCDNRQHLNFHEIFASMPGEAGRAAMLIAHAGAVHVYKRNRELIYLGIPDPPGHSDITTYTHSGTVVTFYADYAAPSGPGGQIEYHQYLVARCYPMASYNAFKRTQRWLKNIEDHWMERWNTLKPQLLGHWKDIWGGLSPIAEGALLIEEESPPDTTETSVRK